MRVRKTFIGPRLRQLRKEHGQSQVVMARALGVSPSYVNLLESNQRSVSLQVLLRLGEVYGLDWRALVDDDAPTTLADIKNALEDPVFGDDKPDLEELRAAVDQAPRLAGSLLALHKAYRAVTEQVLVLTEGGDGSAFQSVETVVHDLFRRHRNHFDAMEQAAERFRAGEAIAPDEVYTYLKRRLADGFGIEVVPTSTRDLPNTLRTYDEEARVIRLSDAMDYPNKVFQLAHVAGLLAHRDAIDRIIADGKVEGAREQARCRVELANYFGAAMLMPYERYLDEAESTGYDIEHLAAHFGVSFEQACHRLTTLQRDGRPGVPMFFMRIDRAGNVTKRFNATSFNLAQYGGACPRWDIHQSFAVPGRILPQFVELPDGIRYFTISRTVDRPRLDRHTHDHRLAVTLGCSIEHAAKLIYAQSFKLGEADLATPIGINCRMCPRQHCPQRAHQPLHLDLPIDEHRRGQTRFES